MSDIIGELEQEVRAAELNTPDLLEAFRIRYLGRKSGLVTNLFKRISEVGAEERRTFGARVNALKALAETRITEAEEALRSQRKGAVTERLDLTLPGRMPLPEGSIHPITQTLDEILRFFAHFGFNVAEGPEIEDDWHNFTALNFPPDHPARDMQDTFFVEREEGSAESVLLRTHTSPVQIRVLQEQRPPVRVVVPGRVYRNEAISYKSFCLFHQVEGLYVDTQVTLADLKHILLAFARTIFWEDVKVRFRASYFPFTEPSAEVDIWWAIPDHPEGGRWMEILGCGMVDPNVLTNVGIDPEQYSGYAFGMGIERVTMLRYGISDIRLLYENDARFLRQF